MEQGHTYPLNYMSLTLREDLRDELTSYFNPDKFIQFWNLTNQMTLDGIESSDRIIEPSFQRALRWSDIDYREIIFWAFYDRAFLLYRHMDEICGEQKILDTILRPPHNTKSRAHALLRFLWYLDLVFCRKNRDYIRISERMHRWVDALYAKYSDDLDYFPTTSDKTEDEILSAISWLLFHFNMSVYTSFHENYYRDLNSNFFDECDKC